MWNERDETCMHVVICKCATPRIIYEVDDVRRLHYPPIKSQYNIVFNVKLLSKWMSLTTIFYRNFVPKTTILFHWQIQYTVNIFSSITLRIYVEMNRPFHCFTVNLYGKLSNTNSSNSSNYWIVKTLVSIADSVYSQVQV